MIPGKQYTPEALLTVARRRKWLILLPAIVLSVGIGVVARYLPNVYSSDTLILVVPQRVPESYVRSTVTTRIEDRLQSISQQILSRTRLESIIQEFNLYADRRKTDIMEDVVERMRKDIKVDIVKGDAFRVTFSAGDPRTAMKVTERLASFFIDESLRDREVLAEGTNQFLESQLEEARRQLIDNEQKLADYRRRHDGELPTQLDSNMQGLHNTEMQLQALVESINRDRDRRLILERVMADASAPDVDPVSAPAQAAVPGDDARAAGTAAEQLSKAEAALRAMQMRLTPEHPDVIRARRTIAELRQRADVEAAERPTVAPAPPSAAQLARRNRLEEARTEFESLGRQITDKTADEQRLRGVLATYQRRIEAAPARDSELAELTRDYETLQQSYRALLAKKQESQIAANLERRQIGEQFKILDPARLPEKPSKPNRPLITLIGICAAIAIGLAFAGAAEYVDRGLRSEEDVIAALNLPVLAAIPLVAPQRSTKRRRVTIAAFATTLTAALVLAGAVAWRLLN